MIKLQKNISKIGKNITKQIKTKSKKTVNKLIKC